MGSSLQDCEALFRHSLRGGGGWVLSPGTELALCICYWIKCTNSIRSQHPGLVSSLSRQCPTRWATVSCPLACLRSSHMVLELLTIQWDSCSRRGWRVPLALSSLWLGGLGSWLRSGNHGFKSPSSCERPTIHASLFPLGQKVQSPSSSTFLPRHGFTKPRL